MKGVLADINVQGHLDLLIQIWQGEDWYEVWQALALQALKFADLGLDPRTTDDVLWQECQDRQLALLTANRNDDGPTSLEATIQARNTPDCLPVFTLANAQRVLADRAYAVTVAVALLDYFLDIDNFRGTGRMYVPPAALPSP